MLSGAGRGGAEEVPKTGSRHASSKHATGEEGRTQRWEPDEQERATVLGRRARRRVGRGGARRRVGEEGVSQGLGGGHHQERDRREKLER